jgi:hypothetical protein
MHFTLFFFFFNATWFFLFWLVCMRLTSKMDPFVHGSKQLPIGTVGEYIDNGDYINNIDYIDNGDYIDGGNKGAYKYCSYRQKVYVNKSSTDFKSDTFKYNRRISNVK